MNWFGHVLTHDTLANTILQGHVDDTRKRYRPKKNWMDDVYKWNGMLPILT